MKELTCPYCEADQEPNCDNLEPNQLFKHECENCGKVFGYEIEYYPSYMECELPCANGEPHKWKVINGYPVEAFLNRRRCEYCEEEKTFNPEELGTP